VHYRNGREAKNGDLVIQLEVGRAKISSVGILIDAAPGSDYCNGRIVSIVPTLTGACLCDCIHADDLAAILTEKGLDKRPIGK
jgi:hypothetical protein